MKAFTEQALIEFDLDKKATRAKKTNTVDRSYDAVIKVMTSSSGYDAIQDNDDDASELMANAKAITCEGYGSHIWFVKVSIKTQSKGHPPAYAVPFELFMYYKACMDKKFFDEEMESLEATLELKNSSRARKIKRRESKRTKEEIGKVLDNTDPSTRMMFTAVEEIRTLVNENNTNVKEVLTLLREANADKGTSKAKAKQTGKAKTTSQTNDGKEAEDDKKRAGNSVEKQKQTKKPRVTTPPNPTPNGVVKEKVKEIEKEAPQD